MPVLLLVILVGLCVPPRLVRGAPDRVRAAARLVGHVAPALALPLGAFDLAWNGSFVVALLALGGYLAGAVRAAKVAVPPLTAERSLLHPWLVGRDALLTLGGRAH